MGTCKYCGRKAGFFSHVHKECEIKHENGLRELEEYVKINLSDFCSIEKIDSGIRQIAKDCYLTEPETKDCIVSGVQKKYIDIDNLLPILKIVESLFGRYNISCLNITDKVSSIAGLLVISMAKDFLHEKIEVEDIKNVRSFLGESFSISENVFSHAFAGALKTHLEKEAYSIDVVSRYSDSFCNHLSESELLDTFGYTVRCLTEQYFEGTLSLLECKEKIKQLIGEDNLLYFEDLFLDSLRKASEVYLEDGILTEEERARFDSFADAFNLPLGNLPTKYIDSSILKVCQLGLLKDIQTGIKPDVNVNAPIFLASNEYYIWAYNNVTAYEEKTESQWVGKSNGISLRVCKGVYYRVGQSRGHKVEKQYMSPTAIGALLVTNKNLIFYSSVKSIKIPYKKIIGVVPYSDGIEIQRESNSKRLLFEGLDPWFIMNVFSVLDI